MDIETELRDICKRHKFEYIGHKLTPDHIIETCVRRISDGEMGILKHSDHELYMNELERKLRES